MTRGAQDGEVSKESVGIAAASGFGNLGQADLVPSVAAGGAGH